MEYAIHMEYSTIEQEWTENGNSRRMERNRGDEEEDAQGVDADEEKKKKKRNGRKYTSGKNVEWISRHWNVH